MSEKYAVKMPEIYGNTILNTGYYEKFIANEFPQIYYGFTLLICNMKNFILLID
jgi:hypothetical protein